MKRLLFLFIIIYNLCMAQNTTKQITLGGGCFWCIEAAFEDAKGVELVVSGFSGGKIKNPAYREVVNGKTNHAEVCQISYNPEIINLNNILEIFFLVHDPTTLNRQGNDVGRHYRSIILYHNDNELDLIKREVEKYNKEYFNNKIVTEIQKYEAFYPAEEYHQEYYKNNSEQPYCKIVIEPKLQKARKLLNKYY
ncbi:MAG: peptide-methionine (S)-S-oxide reductase MsrA [Flavobacteriales bacterium]|nr:peptide-methionine (S)-S-oxide reductase MsrA [Flavobacteriales bacterium]MBL6873678.1 peptide-methionine (S)-S-oxide reductase MsrA [Flavobacteriales bacterium]